MSKGKIDIQDIAERIDDLILEPAQMQKWRDQVKRGLKRFKSGKDLKEALIGCDPAKDIIPFYTVLACCHDDFLKVNYIFTDTLKTINPQLCNYPDICVYNTQGVPRMLSRYLIYVERDLSGVDKDENIVDKRNEDQQGKDDYGREKPWDDNNYDYVPLSEALSNFADNKIPLPTMSKKLTPDGPIDYMRKGQRCKVHYGQFRKFIKNEHPEIKAFGDIADEYIAGIEARKTISRRKKQAGE